MRAFSGVSRRVPSVIAFRSITDADLPFLARLYASTRAEEVARAPGWSEQQKREFLQLQFDAQHRFYQEQFPRADYQIIERGGEPIGRVYTDRRDAEIRLIDIALLPAHRGGGLGRLLIEDLQEEASEQGLPLRIHVEKNNPAYRLYLRLGFETIADKGVYDLLEWSPGADSRSDSTPAMSREQYD